MTTLTTPQKGLRHDAGHRYYYRDKGPFPSASTIAGVIDKSGPLVGWAKRVAAETAVHNHTHVGDLIAQQGEDVAVAYVASTPDLQRDAAADLGSSVHRIANEINTGASSMTPEQKPYIDGYLDWYHTVGPDIRYSECMVINLTEGCAGTFDIGAVINGSWVLLDIKTGKHVYEETAIQLAIYDIAEFSATEDDPTPIALPRWQHHAVLHLGPQLPNGWEVVPFKITDNTRDAARAALRLHNWRRNDAGSIRQASITSIHYGKGEQQ
jgi:hypothetical protein